MNYNIKFYYTTDSRYILHSVYYEICCLSFCYLGEIGAVYPKLESPEAAIQLIKRRIKAAPERLSQNFFPALADVIV